MTESDPRWTPAPPPLPRKLMDPNHPQPASDRKEMSLTHVQELVMSVLVTTTLLHLSAGIVVAAFFVDGRLNSQIGLLVIGGIFGVVGVAAGFAIHRRRILSW